MTDDETRADRREQYYRILRTFKHNSGPAESLPDTAPKHVAYRAGQQVGADQDAVDRRLRAMVENQDVIELDRGGEESRYVVVAFEWAVAATDELREAGELRTMMRALPSPTTAREASLMETLDQALPEGEQHRLPDGETA